MKRTVDPLTKTLEAAQASMQADVAGMKRKLRGIGDLPVDHATAVQELSDEQRALRDSRPTNRRWEGARETRPERRPNATTSA